MSDLALRYDEHYTYKDYAAWTLKEGERYELFSGEARAMASPSTYHQLISVELSGVFRDFFKGKPCRPLAAPYDVRLYARDEDDEDDDVVLQPDLLVVCDPKKLSAAKGCIGAPDLVVEILSPSNTVREMNKKFNYYKSSGVREYWIIYPDTKELQLIPLASSDSKKDIFYETPQIAESLIFQGLKVDLSALFAEIPL